jgi:hypothetical protein
MRGESRDGCRSWISVRDFGHNGRVEKYRVAGVESRDHLAFLVSELDEAENVRLASNLAAPVREFRARASKSDKKTSRETEEGGRIPRSQGGTRTIARLYRSPTLAARTVSFTAELCWASNSESKTNPNIESRLISGTSCLSEAADVDYHSSALSISIVGVKPEN